MSRNGSCSTRGVSINAAQGMVAVRHKECCGIAAFLAVIRPIGVVQSLAR